MSNLPNAPDARQDSSTSPADYTLPLRVLDFLFEGVSGGFVEFRFFIPGKKQKAIAAPTYLTLPLNKERVIAEVLNHGEARMVAVGPSPRCRIPGRGLMGTDRDVQQVSCIWANIEHRKAASGAIEVLRRIRDLPLRPSVVVSAGFSHEVYYVFPAPLRDHQLLEWSELTRVLCDLLSADKITGISHVASLPGTLNLQETYAVPCEIAEEYTSWVRYRVGELKDALHALTRSDSSTSTDIVLGAALQGVPYSVEHLRQRGLDAETIEAILTGRSVAGLSISNAAGSSDSGRDFLIAHRLFERGFSEEEIKAIFRAHPHGCGGRWTQKRDGEKYLDSLLRKVTAKHREARGVAPDDAWESEDEGLFTRELPPNYLEHEDGSIWFHPPVRDEGRKVPQPVKVCNSMLRITGIQEHIDTGQISVVISFNYLGRVVSAPILRSQMADARQLVVTLSGVGAPITSINARLITAYLAAYEHSFAASIPRKKVTSRFGRGRSGGHFFFPGLSSGVEFAPAGAGDASLFRAYSSRRGTLRQWLEAMRVIADETLLIPQVAVLAALVPPLQRRLQLPNFILDLHGNTSTGKSTSLKLAASVYGRPLDPDSLILQWMNTSVAIEQVAAVCSELPVFLDDAQHCPAELKRLVIYMIANGRGKGRGAKGGRGGISETPTWNTVALSTSEEPLHESSPHEGARGRILSVGGLVPPFRPGMASLVQGVERIVAHHHGHAGEAYIRHLNAWTMVDTERWYRRYTEIRHELLRSSSSDLVGRVGGYIAAIQLAAELACPLLGLPFKADVVGAWLALHVDEQQRNQNMILLALRALADHYVSQLTHFAGDGRYDPSSRIKIQGTSKSPHYVGFLRSTVDAVFKARKWNPTAVLNKLAEAGVLYATETGRHTKKVSIEGVKHRLVCVKWSALLPDDKNPLP
jgi:hypothetical protein